MGAGLDANFFSVVNLGTAMQEIPPVIKNCTHKPF